jgi:hypothetical protein
VSLNWDITKCADPDALLTDGARDLTDAVIWATMFTGIGEITEATLPEFYARLKVGGYWGNDGPSYADLVPYIGLRTNVFPKDTRTKWLKRIIGQRLDEEVAKAERAARAIERSNGQVPA